MNLSDQEIDLIKQKTVNYLTKSIYKLCFLLGKEPEEALKAQSLQDLIGSVELSTMQTDAFTSLYNQIVALKKLQ